MKMSRVGSWGMMALAVVALGGCSSSQSSAEGVELEPVKDPEYSSDDALSKGMQEFQNTVAQLLPYVASTEDFRDDDNAEEIADLLKTFASQVEHTSPAMMQWPHYQTTLVALKELVDDSAQVYEARQRERARIGVQWAVGMCVSCHVQHEKKRLQVDIDLEGLAEHAGDDFERARLMIAFQQNAEAREQLAALIESYPNNVLEGGRLDQALELYATLVIRSEADPARALEVFDKLAARDNLPAPVRKYLKVWVGDLEKWNKDRNADPVKPRRRIKKAKKILGRLSERLPPPNDRRKYVAYLRASRLLHPVLDENVAARMAADAEMMLGLCYASLDRNLFFGLDTMFLKACIDRVPDSKQANKCEKLLGRALARRYGAPDDDTMMPEQARADLERFHKRQRKRRRR